MTTPTAAGYRPGTGYRRCWNCQHFTLPPVPEAAAGPDGPAAPRPTCAVLRMPVEATAVCDRWLQMADAAKKKTGFRSALRQHGEFIWDDGAGAPARRDPTAGPSGEDGDGGGRGGPLGL